MRISPRHIDESLADRCRKASAYLGWMCNECDLPRAINGAKRWAIVGGVVRDLLTRADVNSQPIPGIAWPDVDVAVAEGSLEIDHRILKVRNSISNSYGGLKITSDSLGTVDLWLWPGSPTDLPGQFVWLRLLDRIEFGVNAVAFIWPEQEVIYHPQWRADFLACRVETLTKTVLRRDLHVVRALAIATRLGSQLNRTMNFGPKVKADIEWLLSEAEETEIGSSLAYLQSKVSEGRWPTSITRRLAECVQLAEKNGTKISETFYRAIRPMNIA
jgi:hypothetical protein